MSPSLAAVGAAARPSPRLPGSGLAVPEAFQAIAVDEATDAFARARRAAPRGADHGTLFWTAGQGRIRLGLVLEPSRALPEALLALYVLAVAAGEAAPGLRHAWPGDLLLAGRRVGQLRAAAAPLSDLEAAPPWLTLGIDLSLPPLGEADDAPALAARILRRLLAWQERWREEGFEPVRAAWNAGCHALGSSGTLWLAGQGHGGPIGGLDAAGRFVIGDARLSLAAALPELD